jgi:hypothetical protein
MLVYSMPYLPSVVAAVLAVRKSDWSSFTPASHFTAQRILALLLLQALCAGLVCAGRPATHPFHM